MWSIVPRRLRDRPLAVPPWRKSLHISGVTTDVVAFTELFKRIRFSVTNGRSPPVSVFSVHETKTRSSAVAAIADRTAYDVRYTAKLSNRFRLQIYERLHVPIQRAKFINALKLKRDWSKFTKSVNNRAYHTTSARLIVCLKNSRSRFLRLVFLVFFLCVLWLNDA